MQLFLAAGFDAESRYRSSQAEPARGDRKGPCYIYIYIYIYIYTYIIYIYIYMI